MAQDQPTVRYFALVSDGGIAAAATGLVRRIQAGPVPTDEELGPDLRWRPSDYLQLYHLGHNDQDHVEVTAEFAAQLVAGWRAKAAARD